MKRLGELDDSNGSGAAGGHANRELQEILTAVDAQKRTNEFVETNVKAARNTLAAPDAKQQKVLEQDQ